VKPVRTCTALCMLAVASCRDSSGSRLSVLHPTPDNVVPDSKLACVIGDAAHVGERSALAVQARALAASRVVAVVGAANGDEAGTFGAVTAVAVDATGDVFVLDGARRQIRLVRAAGTAAGSVPAGAREALSLKAPTQITIASHGRIAVADRDRLVRVYETLSPEVRGTTVRVPFVPTGVCAIDDELLVRGHRRDEGHVIHVYAMDGRHVRSFADGYRSPNWLVRHAMSEGLIGCSPSDRVVVSMFTFMPFVYGYSASGELLWVSRIGDFLPRRVKEGVDSDNRPEVLADPRGTTDVAVKLTGLGNGYVLAQTLRTRSTGGADEREVRSYLVEATTGRGVGIGTMLPIVLGARLPRLYAVDPQQPFPRLIVLRVPGD